MTCEEARDRLLDAQRARLAPEPRAALQGHLQTCAACAHEEAADALLSEALESRLPQHAAAACESGAQARRDAAMRGLDRRLRMGYSGASGVYRERGPRSGLSGKP